MAPRGARIESGESARNEGVSSDQGLPETFPVEGEDYSESKEVLVKTSGGNMFVVKLDHNTEYDSGYEGGWWENWYCDSIEDCIDNVVAWCDCLPE